MVPIMGEAAADAKQTYTLTDLKANTTEKSCYLLIDEKVYNVTEFLDEHPGGRCMQLYVASMPWAHAGAHS